MWMVGSTRATRPSLRDILMWLGLAAAPSVAMLATMNHVCQEVAVVPFLWILPLSLYLLSFIVCFDNERWYHRGFFGVFLVVTGVLACVVLFVHEVTF